MLKKPATSVKSKKGGVAFGIAVSDDDEKGKSDERATGLPQPSRAVGGLERGADFPFLPLGTGRGPCASKFRLGHPTSVNKLFVIRDRNEFTMCKFCKCVCSYGYVHYSECACRHGQMCFKDRSTSILWI